MNVVLLGILQMITSFSSKMFVTIVFSRKILHRDLKTRYISLM